MTSNLINKEVKAVVYNFQSWIAETRPEILKKTLRNLLDDSGYTVLNSMEHTFPNGGYTCLWLLSESHLAVHTFIHENKSYVELSGCNKEMNQKFIAAFNLQFEYLIISGHHEAESN